MGTSQSINTEKNFNYYRDLISQNNVEIIRRTFNNPDVKVDVNMINDNGDTLLMCAVEHRFNLIAEELIKLGIDVNNRNSIGWTALFFAVIDNNCTMVNTLLANGANPDVKNSLEDTTLHLAIKRRRLIDIIEMLIDKFEDVDVIDMEGNTPLIWACMNNDMKTTELLLKKGADPNRRNQYGIYPLALTTDKQMQDLLISRGGKLPV